MAKRKPNPQARRIMLYWDSGNCLPVAHVIPTKKTTEDFVAEELSDGEIAVTARLENVKRWTKGGWKSHDLPKGDNIDDPKTYQSI